VEGLAFEGRTAHQQPVGDAGGGEDIRARIGRTTTELLGGQAQPGAALRREVDLDPAIRSGTDPAVMEVAVHHAPGVRGGHVGADPVDPGDLLRERHLGLRGGDGERDRAQQETVAHCDRRLDHRNAIDLAAALRLQVRQRHLAVGPDVDARVPAGDAEVPEGDVALVGIAPDDETRRPERYRPELVLIREDEPRGRERLWACQALVSSIFIPPSA
jgi:hypothetical protein